MKKTVIKNGKYNMSNIMYGLRNIKEESIVDNVKPVEVQEGSKEDRHKVFAEIAEMCKESLESESLKIYIEPIVDKGDILVFDYKGHTFEMK